MKKKLKVLGLLLKVAPIAYKLFKKYKARKATGRKTTIQLPKRH